jgi:hypothetical protein
MPVTWLAEDEWSERELRGVLKLSGGGPDNLLRASGNSEDVEDPFDLSVRAASGAVVAEQQLIHE